MLKFNEIYDPSYDIDVCCQSLILWDFILFFFFLNFLNKNQFWPVLTFVKRQILA